MSLITINANVCGYGQSIIKIKIDMKTKLRNLLKSALIIAVVSSCEPIDKFENLKAPIIVVAKDTTGCVTLIDKNNKYVTLPNTYYLALTLSNTYSIGDTLFYSK